MMGGKIKLLKKKRRINWAFLISPATLTNPRRFKHFCYCFFFFLYLFLCYITLSWWCMYIEEALHVLVFRIMRWGGGACGPKESWHLEIHETGKRRSYQICVWTSLTIVNCLPERSPPVKARWGFSSITYHPLLQRHAFCRCHLTSKSKSHWFLFICIGCFTDHGPFKVKHYSWNMSSTLILWLCID